MPWSDIKISQIKKIDDFIKSHTDNIIFIHAREPHNIKYYKDKYNAMTVLITNPNAKKVQGNHADREVNKYDYDLIIENDGTIEDLKDTAKWFLTNK